ncbi:MAG: response regulator transcription factor [Methylophilaceae bacterium]|nr:response regulator transcription factor [Methylophilaceae bacterium]
MKQNPLKILIVDDEAPARRRLRELLAELVDVVVVGEASNGREALAVLNEIPADLLLLDVRMPEMDGMETAEQVQKMQYPPAIVFTTAYDAHALQAFDKNAVDYLLKPIRLERLQKAIQKTRTMRPMQPATAISLPTKRSHFNIFERGRVILVALSEVIYLRSELKYITVRTLQHEYLMEDSLNALEQEFGEQFLRLHRNCLVAKSQISGYEKRKKTHDESHWVAFLKDIPDIIPVSRRQLHLLREFSKPD